MTKIGYYAHYHGNGHSNYARMFAEANPDHTVVFTSSAYVFPENLEVIHLPKEDIDGTELQIQKPEALSYLHHSPVGLKKITRRCFKILEQVIALEIELLIVDVSVEVAMLARASSIPYVYRRMPGNRDDLPHLQAYEGATFLVAYYPEQFESKSTPQWIRDKTYYLGFIASKRLTLSSVVSPVEFSNYVLYLQGLGGCSTSQNFIYELATIFQKQPIIILGGLKPPDNIPENVFHLGVVDCTSEYIKNADIIIASCGSNTTIDILSQGKKFLILPQTRPYEEQLVFAEMLEQYNFGTIVKEGDVQEALEKYNRIKEKPSAIKIKNFNKFWKFLKDNAYHPDQMIKQLNSSKVSPVEL